MAFTPDDNLVVTGSQGGNVTGWESRGGARVWTAASGIVNELALSHDESLISLRVVPRPVEPLG
jgi:hypothetical protein